MKRQINIDKQIDKCLCPAPFFCTVATTCYDEMTREHLCYKCWLNYCNENDIEIIYN